jgi:hypothetical protein
MKVATGEGWGTTERYSLGARQPNGALVAVKEDTAAVTKLLLVCLVTKSGKVIVGLLVERKKSKRKNSPWIRPDVDTHAGKKATCRLR